MAKNSVALSARHLAFGYGPRHLPAQFSELNIDLPVGSLTCLIGPNGSGKSSLLRALAGFLPLRAGQMLVAGHLVHSLRQRAKLMAYVPQQSPVVPLTVYETVMLGRTPHMWFRPREKDHAAVCAALEIMGVRGWNERQVDELSGGERQKVLLARALAQECPLLLLDEPAHSLDVGHQLNLYQCLRTLVQGPRPTTILVVEHDLNLAARFADSLYLIHKGSLVQSGSPEEVLSPAHLRDIYGVDGSMRTLDNALHLHIRTTLGQP